MEKIKEEIRHKEILKFLKEKGDYLNQSQHIPLFEVISHIEDWDDIRTTSLTDQIKSMENYISDVDGQVKELKSERNNAVNKHEIIKEVLNEIREHCGLVSGETILHYIKVLQEKNKGLNDTCNKTQFEYVNLQSQLESLQKEFNNANDLNSEKNGIILSLQSQLTEALESNGEYHKALQNIMINERWLEMNINEVNQLLSGNKPTQD
jgi:chromosome segregation ATPase